MSQQIRFAVTVIFLLFAFLLMACGSPAPTIQPAPTETPVLQMYPDKGIHLKLPIQPSGVEIYSTPMAFDFDSIKLVEVKGAYSLERPIIYLNVYDQKGNVVEKFDNPIVFTADIPADLQVIADELVILLFDAKEMVWVPCDGNAENLTATTKCGKTVINENKTSGWTSISEWTSGAGWGRR